MSTPERPSRRPLDADGLARRAERRLRRMGVRREDRSAIVETVHADLLAAEADGRRPADLLGPDLDDFLRRTVTEGGHPVERPGPIRLALAGTAVSVLAALLTGVVLWSVVVPLFSSTVSPALHLPRTGVVGGWLGVGLTSLAAALVVLGLLVRGRAGAGPTMAAASVTLLLAAAAGIGGNLAVLQQGWPITPGSIALQVSCALLPLALAILTARWWGLRHAGAADATSA